MEKVNKIALIVNDDKRIEPTCSIETYAYWIDKEIILKTK